MGCGSKLTTELLTWHTCPFLSAKSKNKLVIRGHLLPPDNTYGEKDHSVGGSPGILAAVGSSSFVDCFTPHPELVCPSCGPPAGWEEARREGCGLFPRRALPCQPACMRAEAATRAAAVPRSPAAADGPLGVGALGLSACLQGREQSGWEKRACAGLCLFLPSAFPEDAVHSLVSCPQGSSPEEKHSRRLCVS